MSKPRFFILFIYFLKKINEKTKFTIEETNFTIKDYLNHAIFFY